MTLSKPPSPIRAADYDAIEAALLESARGRWFLSEFARRNRAADTQVLLNAINKLELAVTGARPRPKAELVRRDLVEMSEAIARTRRAIAAISLPDDEAAPPAMPGDELDASIRSSERATAGILRAAEDIQEIAWRLREKGQEAATCDKLEQRARAICKACSVHEIAARGSEALVTALRGVESQVCAMLRLWADGEAAGDSDALAPAHPHALPPNGPQRDADRVLEPGVSEAVYEDLDDDIDVIAVDPELYELEFEAAPSPFHGGDAVDVECVEAVDLADPAEAAPAGTAPASGRGPQAPPQPTARARLQALDQDERSLLFS